MTDLSRRALFSVFSPSPAAVPAPAPDSQVPRPAPAPTPAPSLPTDLPLPDLYTATLDRAEALRLLADLERHGTLESVAFKTATERTAIPWEPASLAPARLFVTGSEYRAVQLRYRFRGEPWTDTLVRTPTGDLRLVRARG